ncbi:MAG: hypothetical protein K5769_08420 [Pseudobutyrivibrio sp.]|nr:hypothetical protein [Pseudobutyrivibrio sp.]
MKIKKLSTRITLFVVIATVIGVAILSILASYNIFGVMKQEAVTEIGDAMGSLSGSIDEIARRITSVNDASVENTEGVTNFLGKNTQASDVSVNIEKLAESSKVNAESLKGAINQFKLDE